MCLAVPGKIMRIQNEVATIDYGSEKRKAKVIGEKEYKVGDYVMVMGRVVVQKIPRKKAIASLKFYNEAVSARKKQ